MRPLAEAAIKAGLIDDETLAQLHRWGMVPKDVVPKDDMDLEEIIESIKDALDSEAQVRLQTTDLDLLRLYVNPKNQLRGQLILVADSEQRGTKSVVFVSRTLRSKEQFILPWMSESITELLTNGKSYLRWNVVNPASPSGADISRRVRMVDYEDVYFGDIRMFLVCTGMEDENSIG